MCKKIIIFFAATALFFNSVSAQIVQYNFNTSPFLQASLVDAHLTAGNFSLSTGTISTNITTGTYFTSEPYVEGSSGWTQTDSSLAKNFYFTISAQTGYRFTITGITFEAYTTGTGPSATTVFVSGKAIGTHNMPADLIQTIGVSVTGVENKTSATIKLAGWLNGSRSSSGGGYFRIDNITVTGTVEIIPPNDANSTLAAGNGVEPNSISSLINSPESFMALDFIITDRATTDAVSTLIDSIIFTPAPGNEFSDWTQVIDAANLYSVRSDQTFSGIVRGNQIKFNTAAWSGVTNGSDDTLSLWVSLKSQIPLADNKHLGFNLSTSKIYSNAAGSGLATSEIANSPTELKINVIATKVMANLFPSLIFVDSLYPISVKATDLHGNIDQDWNQEVSFRAQSDHGYLYSTDDLNTAFSSGLVTWNNCRVTVTDTFKINLAAENLVEINGNVIAGQPVFVTQFEENNLNRWTHVNDWTNSNTNAIAGNYSLKHNLTGIGGQSYITGHYLDSTFNDAKSIWRLILKNGDFDPTSTNRFWYYLMASDSNLSVTSIYGYAVGVNLTGSSDSLSLWRVDGSGTKTLLLQSQLDWNANTTAAIEVIREAPGNWKLGYSTGNSFNHIIYTGTTSDHSFSDLAYHGLVYQFSSTRAGLLEADSVAFFKLNTPPVIVSANGLNDSLIEVVFSEPVDSATAVNQANYQLNSVTNNGIRITRIVYTGENPEKVILYVSRLMTDTYQLSVHGIKDKKGLILQQQSIQFNYFVEAVLHDLVFNEIMFDCTPVIDLPEYDYIEVYNRSINPFLLNGWKLQIDNEIRTMPDARIEPQNYLVITSSGAVTQFSEFGQVVNGITTTSLTNSGRALKLISPQGIMVDSIYYKPGWIIDEDKADGGWSLERIDAENFCGESTNWVASNDLTGGTPGKLNSVYHSNTDTIKPKVVSCQFSARNAITINFSEEINDIPVLDFNNWIFTPTLADSANIVISADRKTVIYNLDHNFTADQHYQLQWKNMTDLCANRMGDTIIHLLFHPAGVHDVVINEIMADPSPVVGLPEHDYLELYNRSSYPIDLTNWNLLIGTTKKVFSPIVIQPKQYLIICPAGQDSLFENYGAVAGLLSSTSLVTTGKDLVLKDTTGLVIDSVYYKTSWYGDENKADGGWSLERIDPENFCGESTNWIASEDSTGGTPGKINSVYKPNNDTVSPGISQWRFISQTAIEVDFTEEITTSEIINDTNWIFEPAWPLGNPIMLSGDRKTAIYTAALNVIPNQTYTLQWKGIHDLCGNQLSDTTLNILFHPANTAEVVFNEVMADPTPSVGLPEHDYVELYNQSNYTIDLTNWILKIGTTKKVFEPIFIQPKQYLILCPSGQESYFEEFGPVTGILSSTSLPTTGKDLVLIDTTGLIIDSIYYAPTWYGDENKTDGGWSMERVDPENTCSLAGNWKASVADIGGTPGHTNSVYASFIDTVPPRVTQIRTISKNHLQIGFNKPVDRSNMLYPGRFAVNMSIGLPDSVRIDNSNINWVDLYFSKSLISTFTYQITLKNIVDGCKNRMPDTTVSLLYYVPKPFDIVFTEIMPDASPSVELPEVKYLELYNRSNYPIDLTQFTLVYDNYQREFPFHLIEPKSYLVLCPENQAASLAGYGEVLDVLSSTTLTTTGRNLILRDSSGLVIDALNYKAFWLEGDKGDGGWSLEKIDPDNTCSGKANWSFSENMEGGTPGSINSVNQANIDQLKPELVYYEITGKRKFKLEFSEPIPDSLLTNTKNYIFSALTQSVVQVDMTTDDATAIEATTSNDFEPNIPYALEINGLTDLCSNRMDSRQIAMTFYEALPNDIVITEIMTDPSPVIGLPEQEYIELYNRSNKIINLEGWYISVNSTKKALSRYNLHANKRLILCATAGLEELQTFGEAMAVPSFPSITNSGANIQLLDTAQTLINEVNFTQSWYANPDKEDGGWSLEIIDPDNLCGKEYNWKASVDINGGTPGQENSVNHTNIDLQPIQLNNLAPTGPNQIWLQFSEGASQTELTNPANYTLKNIGNPIQVLPDSMNKSVVWLDFRQAMLSGDSQLLTVKNIADYCQNAMTDTSVTFTYYQPKLYDLVINEIMANPEPSVGLPTVEYIEIYNRTGYGIYLNGFTIAIGTSKKTITQGFIASNDYALLVKSTVTDSLLAFGNVIGVESLSSLSLSGSISLFNQDNRLICSTEYSSNWFASDLKAEGGFSLERIDFNNPGETSANWNETNDIKGGTPGRQNSVYNLNPDTLKPQLLYAVPINASKVRVVFSKLMAFENNPQNLFSITPTIGQPISVEQINNQWNAVDLTLANPLAKNQEYQLHLDATLTDIVGNPLVNRMVTFMLPDNALVGDAVINEILFNPKPGGTDFVELYNRSGHPINLAEFYLASRDEAGNIKSPQRIPLPGFILKAESYVALSTDANSIKKQYVIKDSLAFFDVPALPAMADDAGSLVLLDTLGNIYDELVYSSKMHFALLETNEGVSLERIDYNQPANVPANWQSAAQQAGWATPGYKNSVFAKIDSNKPTPILFVNEVFSPDNDGYNDQLTISYQFIQPGFVANVTIFSANGVLIRKLVQNELMGTEGFWAWDGLDDSQNKVPIGIYVVYFELFDLNGKIEKIQKVCVVSGKL